MLNWYKVDHAIGDQLKATFNIYCGSCPASLASRSKKEELSLAGWISWLSPFLPSMLLEVLFESKLGPARTAWRFVDFLDICLMFGVATLEQQVTFLCSAFQRTGELEAADGMVDVRRMRTMVTLLTQKPRDTSNVHTSFYGREQRDNRNRAVDIRVSTDAGDMDVETNDELWGAGGSSAFAPALESDLSALENKSRKSSEGGNITIQDYVQLLINHESTLPTLRELHWACCYVLGVRPPTRQDEQGLAVELNLRHASTVGVHCSLPYGRPGTEWCLVGAEWMESWEMHVGKNGNEVC